MAYNCRTPVSSFSQFLAISIVGVVACLIDLVPARAREPDIYFYPPPVILANGAVISSPLAVDVHQLTTEFPAITEMAGIVLVLPWSTISPRKDVYDYDLIDQALAYWGARGKKIALGISTAGPPILASRDGQTFYQQETPSWVTASNLTYSSPTAPIGHMNADKQIETQYPLYWNEKFAPLFMELIEKLGRRYDGNPTLSFVRISTGLVGEDSPEPFGSHPELAPGYNFRAWIKYSLAIVDAYERAFRHTRLELDLTFIPWGYTLGDILDKASADNFVNLLIQKRVFVAFNGWQPDALIWHHHAANPGFALNRLMYYLDQFVDRGLPIGLEALGPMMVPKLQNIVALQAVEHELRPERLVFFGLDAGGIVFARQGSGPTTIASEKWMQGRSQALQELGNLSIRLLTASPN